jgi:Domain of unknown function (DUF4932)
MKKIPLLVLINCFAINFLSAQKNVAILKTNKSKLSYKVGMEYKKDGWTITPSINLDILSITIDKPTNVTFYSENDSIFFLVKPNHNYNFIIQLHDTINTNVQIKATKKPIKAIFNHAYKKQNDKQTTVEIPEVYELMNIIFALTQTGKKNNAIIEKSTEYYNDVINFFKPYENEMVISKIDSLFAKKLIYHCELKLDSYSFEFNKNNEIIQKKPYFITSRENFNTLSPYITALQAFAKKSDFRSFYKNHIFFYNDQILYYKDSAQVGKMHQWLDANFPNTQLNSFKVVFSPLVSGWQNANEINNNGFTEAFAHVNYPYYRSQKLSLAADGLRRGNNIFTELNHIFLSSQRRKDENNLRINEAITNTYDWIDSTKTSKNYNTPTGCFDEYMNWALVSLWYVDNAPKPELDLLTKSIEQFMVVTRGFKRFKEFNQYLINLYNTKKEVSNIDGLYPQIIDWFKHFK